MKVVKIIIIIIADLCTFTEVYHFFRTNSGKYQFYLAGVSRLNSASCLARTAGQDRD